MQDGKLRRKFLHDGSGQLTYEIREIVRLAHQFQDLGLPITWENIGDPIEKGEKIAGWIKEIIIKLVEEDYSYGYSSTQGNPQAREFLADLANQRGGCEISADDITFFNGLGDAVGKVFGYLKKEARVIGPSPAYSTHSSAEAAHSGYKHLTYKLDPDNNWMPDIEDLRKKVKYNDSIAGLLLINPDNPTGAVYPRKILKEMVDIAREHRLFMICDEIYANIIYNGSDTAALSQVIGDVPGIALRGISKEYPWPGARCGWMEVYNQDKYPAFKTYIDTLINAKMLEVSSTNLPQLSIPLVMGDPRYPKHLTARRNLYANRAEEAYRILSEVEGIRVIKPQGAFYMTVLFEENVLEDHQQLTIGDDGIRDLLNDNLEEISLDKRFVYYLLASTGICVVPLTGFASDKNGFRLTLLETDDDKRRRTLHTIAESIGAYLSS
ncbi:pyridoxal phosphate-dependent aminotransferase [Fodinibius sediminis]|uniref:alanine transaminase n=1 Tax=Fodinibius sediminis TaxID=1214077 RepID=A0A521E5V4_9BACT|nr:pyridoxal phosphate-dependent aminotransferase [Fodinibius sediminis]SMO79265.1 Aspartate/methionine/tyrosine aminotransferase [Fodinibius sediminis]